MTRHLFIIFFVMGLFGCAPAPATATPTQSTSAVQATLTPEAELPIEWSGVVMLSDGSMDSIHVVFTGTGGTLEIEPYKKTYPITDSKRAGTKISFNSMIKDQWHFSGDFDGSQIMGQVEENGQTDSFSLLPLFSAPKETLNEFTGTYQFDSGESLLINLAPEYSSSGFYFFGQGLMLTDFRTGAVRPLYPIAKDIFLVGSARAIGYPFAEQITFRRDSTGSVTNLAIQSRDINTGVLGPGSQAVRLNIQSETVHFTSEDGTPLAGLLTLPATSGPHPAIMMVHGSEPGTKDDFGDQEMSAFMASQGIVILTYDKRGVGDSGGHYSDSASEVNLNFTAGDIIAGVEYLKSRPEVRADTIGLIGYSQAGWVIPIAASQSKDVSYFIILSGPVTSVGHESFYSSFTLNGDSPTNYTQEELMKKIAIRPHSGFDSTPVIAKLNQRGLWIFGDQDKSIPVPESVDNLKRIIAKGKSNFTYLVLPNADHNLQQTTDGLFNEIPFSSGFHADFYKIVTQWLVENIK